MFECVGASEPVFVGKVGVFHCVKVLWSSGGEPAHHKECDCVNPNKGSPFPDGWIILRKPQLHLFTTPECVHVLWGLGAPCPASLPLWGLGGFVYSVLLVVRAGSFLLLLSSLLLPSNWLFHRFSDSRFLLQLLIHQLNSYFSLRREKWILWFQLLQCEYFLFSFFPPLWQ